MRFFLILFLACLPCLSQDKTESYTQDITTHQNELKEIKTKLRKNRTEIRKLESRAKDIVTKLTKLDENLTLLGNYIAKLSETEEALQAEVDSIKVDLTTTIENLQNRKGLLKKRVYHIYTRGRFDKMDFVFGARSFSDFIKRYIFFKRIAENDRKLIENIFNQQKRIEEKKQELEFHLAEVKKIKEEKNTEQKQYTTQKRKRKKILTQVNSEKESFLVLSKRLEQRQREVNDIIGALERARKKHLEEARVEALDRFGDFTQLKGKLPWPARGRIIKKFGKNVNIKYETVTINNGIDIELKHRDNIKAIASGEVAFTGQLGGFGNFLILAHGRGFYSLYANLSGIHVKKGEIVEMGKTIGLAGDTGSFEGTKLHFELRQERRVLDPVKWLSNN
jgi:septal ring factor EnvC (AmiA/AmiB activator)